MASSTTSSARPSAKTHAVPSAITGPAATAVDPEADDPSGSPIASASPGRAEPATELTP
jgi:hypothetical protein